MARANRSGWSRPPTAGTSYTSRPRSVSATPSSMTGASRTRRTSRSMSRPAESTSTGSSSYNRFARAKSRAAWQTNKNRFRRSTTVTSYHSGRSSTIDSQSRRAMSVMSAVTDRIPSNAHESEEAVQEDGEHHGAGVDLSDEDEQWVTCITESKGSTGIRTVGIAAFQPSTATCILTQLNDSQTYIRTIHTLSIRWPSVIFTPESSNSVRDKKRSSAGVRLEPSTAKEYERTPLLAYLEQTFGKRKSGMERVRENRDQRRRNEREASATPSMTSNFSKASSSSFVPGYGIANNEGVQVLQLVRRLFDSEAGFNFCEELIIQDEETVMTMDLLKNKYYALSAASALFKYLEDKNRTFSARSLKIRYLPLEGTMLIDAETAKNLELVENLLDKKGRHTLFGFLNHCYTPMAARLLRSNILSPSTDAKLIETRLDVVAEFMASEDRFKNVRRALKNLERIDADKITGSIQSAISINSSQKAKIRKNLDPSKESERKLALMLQLRAFIKAIPQIKNALLDDGGCQSAMLNTIGKILDDERLGMIDDEINNTLNEQVLSSMTKTALSARTSRVFAIKAERKRLLDVARETYKENINDVDELLQDLQLKYPEMLDDVELAYSASGGFTFLIHENILEDKGGELPRIFSKLSKRGKKVAFTCVDLLKRNQRIKQSLDEVFLLSSEPEFTDVLAAKDGRHPVLERYKFTDGGYVPNDTYVNEAASFQLLTGPNMSGKTTFLKQIAMLVIMSQIGSYVPADYASFRLHGALLTRLSNDDSIEGNLSTFALEMKSMSMIISALSTTERPLVLVDELGRGTSPQEGVGIAHSIAEEIIKSKAFCFFATHFLDLSHTLSMYPNVISLHLDADLGEPNRKGEYDENFALTFSHKLRDGCTTVKHYGLEIAKVAALPKDMLMWAKEAADRLNHLEESRKKSAPGIKIANRRKILLNTAYMLREAFKASRMPEHELREYLHTIQDAAITELTADLPPGNGSTAIETLDDGSSEVRRAENSGGDRTSVGSTSQQRGSSPSVDHPPERRTSATLDLQRASPSHSFNHFDRERSMTLDA